MTQIVLASTNPVKTRATLNGFQQMFPGRAFDLVAARGASEVSDQPCTDLETYRGARNRARNLIRQFPDGDFWVGIEGGVEEVGLEMAAFAWVVILGSDRIGHARTASFFLPPKVSQLVRGGMELGEADDEVFGDFNSKQKAGAVGLLTGGAIDRAALYEPAVALALIPFLNTGLFPAQESPQDEASP